MAQLFLECLCTDDSGSSPTCWKKSREQRMSTHNQDKISTYFAFPMSRWRLYSDFKDGKNAGGMIEYVRLFTIIAIIILLIACINFMNLSTARSEKRPRNGHPQTLGSDRKQLRTQFLFESIILTCIALFSPCSWCCSCCLLQYHGGQKAGAAPGDPVLVGAASIILFTAS